MNLGDCSCCPILTESFLNVIELNFVEGDTFSVKPIFHVNNEYD